MAKQLKHIACKELFLNIVTIVLLACSYSSNAQNNKIIDYSNKNVSSILVGKSFVISGVFANFSRDELKKLIESNGGKISSSISSKTSYLVAGSNMGPSKKEKAEKLNIKIISETELSNLISGQNLLF